MMWVVANSADTKSNRHLRLVLAEQERERSDLAHQLHDELAQSLAAVLLGLEGLDKHAGATEAAALAGLREQLADALALCTELAVGLRPAVLDGLGLAAALESLAGRAGADRVSVEPELAIARLGPDLETHVYRTVEESLGPVDAGFDLTVTLDEAGHALLVSIQATDDSWEIDDLERLTARVELLGGTLAARPHALRIRIPVRPANASGFPQRRLVENPDGARRALS
jgi:signal transduction histidine kinase